ncbi:MAG: DUF5103 domain-containing protein [Phaeodactylibacter sp.]|nr:DUF5103 domain-containing protein [Phaeodactylibacter sp.]
MSLRILSFCCVLFLSQALSAQSPSGNCYCDNTYVDYIRSARLHPTGLVLANPILELGSNSQLYLSFDDLSPDVRSYTLAVEHCDADWTPSDLSPTEYIDGFPENTLQDYEFSFNTITPFTHYFITFPNNDIAFTRSGNYILKIYDDEDDRKLVLTRRFMVVESIMQVLPRFVRPAMVHKSDTHQELDLVVAHPGIDIRRPRQEVQVAVVQNWRWDNAVTGLPPLFFRPEEMRFDYQDKLIFEAGKEFRYVDLRSLRFTNTNVYNIQSYDDGVEVTLFKDEKRMNRAYLEFEDINGDYIIGTQDNRDPDLEADYAHVLFSLDSPTEYVGEDVYIFGALTEWQLKPEFKMTYNLQVGAYVADVLLKQGYYDYMYALVPQGSKTIGFADLEGNWHEAKNDYSIFVYYRPFGERYDRLVAAGTFSSRFRQ